MQNWVISTSEILYMQLFPNEMPFPFTQLLGFFFHNLIQTRHQKRKKAFIVCPEFYFSPHLPSVLVMLRLGYLR